MDRIFIENLLVKGKHGVGEEERRVEQEFRVDISAEFDTRVASVSDNLADTLDYSRFRTIAREVVGGLSFYLVEKLADTIALKILEDVRIASVTVSVRKLGVFPDAVPGVTVVRKQI